MIKIFVWFHWITRKQGKKGGKETVTTHIKFNKNVC